MKKFISMVMAAAMVVSLVPATAFAASASKFDVAGAKKINEVQAKAYAGETTGIGTGGIKEVQITIGDVTTLTSATDDTFEITLDFENIKACSAIGNSDYSFNYTDIGAGVFRDTNTNTYTVDKVGLVGYGYVEEDGTSWTLEIKENGENFRVGDMIVIPLGNWWKLASDNEGTIGTVTVSGDFGTSEALPVVSVLAETLDIDVKGKNKEIAEEIPASMARVEIKSVVGPFDASKDLKIKLNKGFEFTMNSISNGDISGATFSTMSKNEIVLDVASPAGNKITINADAIQIEAVKAKAGEIATLTVSHKGYASDVDECAVVIADGVVLSVDEDADVPVMYSGVNREEAGLTSNNSHAALEVTIKETVGGAWNTTPAFTLTLPEGVHVASGSWVADEGVVAGGLDDLGEAYEDGDFVNFDFGRRAVDATTADNDKIKIRLNLELIAEPGFEGEVVLGMEGDGVGEVASVVIAKFVSPYTVEAVANDMIIDYKETEVPSAIVIKEAEEGLWDDRFAVSPSTQATFALEVEKMEVEEFTWAVDADSEMELTGVEVLNDDTAYFAVKTGSDEAPAVVTISEMKLYMDRTIPAGSYDLFLNSRLFRGYEAEDVLGAGSDKVIAVYYDGVLGVDEVTQVVKEGFVNVITAGRDKDDSSFTKQIVVPVGEMYMIAGETTVALDVPAYISAEGYTMMPVRAVATALGINNNSVLWDQATKTVTILYGNRVISMQVGSRVMYVGGTAVPTSAAPEVVNGRTFLPLRDLGTALGVTKFAYDPATKTASMN